jgi:hypothetical protein
MILRYNGSNSVLQFYLMMMRYNGSTLGLEPVQGTKQKTGEEENISTNGNRIGNKSDLIVFWKITLF